MPIIDIIVLVLLAIFAIVGLFRGFFKSVLGLVTNFASIIIAMFCAKPVGALLNSWFKLGGTIGNQIEKGILPNLPEITTSMTKDQVVDALDAVGGSTKQLKYFLGEGPYTSTTQLADQLGNTIGSIIVMVIAALLVYALIRIVVAILRKIFSNATASSSLASGINRILGLVFGLLQGALIIFVVFLLVYFIRGVPLIGTLVEDTITNSTITKWMWDNSAKLIQLIIGKIDFNALVAGMFTA